MCSRCTLEAVIIICVTGTGHSLEESFLILQTSLFVQVRLVESLNKTCSLQPAAGGWGGVVDGLVSGSAGLYEETLFACTSRLVRTRLTGHL